MQKAMAVMVSALDGLCILVHPNLTGGIPSKMDNFNICRDLLCS